MASGSQARSLTWQERLEEICRRNGAASPVFNIISDRRGGRTAWSCVVSVELGAAAGHPIQARFWYDGAFINNAREDAAEVAYSRLTGATAGSPPATAAGSSTAGSGWSGSAGSSGSGSGNYSAGSSSRRW